MHTAAAIMPSTSIDTPIGLPPCERQHHDQARDRDERRDDRGVAHRTIVLAAIEVAPADTQLVLHELATPRTSPGCEAIAAFGELARSRHESRARL